MNRNVVPGSSQRRAAENERDIALEPGPMGALQLLTAATSPINDG